MINEKDERFKIQKIYHSAEGRYPPPTPTLRPPQKSTNQDWTLSETEFREKHGAWDPVYYNLTLCRLQLIYHGQPNARVDSWHSRLQPPIWD